MAIDLGIAIDNGQRIASGIKYSLVLAGNNGNSCVLYENLVKFVSDLLNVNKDNIEEEIINLKAKEEVDLEEREDGEWVYLSYFYNIFISLKCVYNTFGDFVCNHKCVCIFALCF